MGDLTAWVESHTLAQHSHSDITNALDATISVLEGEAATGTSKSVVFAISNYNTDEYSTIEAKVNEITTMQTDAGEDWNVYLLSVGGQLPSGSDGIAGWADERKETTVMPGWQPAGYSGTSPSNGHEIMQGWAEHSCPTP
tara:strand:- start:1182 stop:1601 length:420 start_codon:yes stop_codon:yes gene_type:complete